MRMTLSGMRTLSGLAAVRPGVERAVLPAEPADGAGGLAWRPAWCRVCVTAFVKPLLPPSQPVSS